MEPEAATAGSACEMSAPCASSLLACLAPFFWDLHDTRLCLVSHHRPENDHHARCLTDVSFASCNQARYRTCCHGQSTGVLSQCDEHVKTEQAGTNFWPELTCCSLASRRVISDLAQYVFEHLSQCSHAHHDSAAQAASPLRMPPCCVGRQVLCRPSVLPCNRANIQLSFTMNTNLHYLHYAV